MITSKSNDLIKKCIQIKQKKHSKIFNLCFVESIKLVKELSKKNLVDTILVTNKKYDDVKKFFTGKIEIISDMIAEYISETITTDGVFAICKVPQEIKSECNRSLILDNIQDPSNLGAILRSACAFGFNNVYAINSVYPYTTKCIRSSMGQIFSLNYIDTNIDNLKKIKDKYNIKFLVADMDGENIDNLTINNDENIAIIIGNEGNGVSDEMMNLSDKAISIQMLNNVESLNASVSAGIIMYLLK